MAGEPTLPSDVTAILTRPRVLYYGPDGDDVADRWNGPDRPFEVVGVGPSTAEPTDCEFVDCLVVEASGGAIEEAVERARDIVGSVPVIALQVGTPTADKRVLPAAVDSQITIADGCDRCEVLAGLATLVEELVDTRRRQSLFDSLLERIPLSVYIKDRQGRHIAVSDELLEMIGPPYIENEEGKRHHHPADVRGKTDFDLYDDDLAEERVADDRTIVDTGEPIENKVEDSYDERGRGTLVTTSKAPWYDRTGEVGGVVGVTQDITQRKHYEYQLQRQNERLRRLTTMVSHDIRNPLAAATGRLELAAETGDDVHFAAIERSLERIEDLVGDVLYVTRQGVPVTDPDHLPLAAVAREVWEQMDPDKAMLRTPTSETVVADAGRLRLLLETLFENALEHGREGESITITVGDLETEEGFYVADDGLGIPATDRDGLFDPGLSAADSAGIGLNLGAAITDAHNWNVEATEGPDGGARFEFTGVRLVGA